VLESFQHRHPHRGTASAYIRNTDENFPHVNAFSENLLRASNFFACQKLAKTEFSHFVLVFFFVFYLSRIGPFLCVLRG